MRVIPKYGFHVTVRLCGRRTSNDDDGARSGESEKMHHSLTGREQSLVRVHGSTKSRSLALDGVGGDCR